MWGRVGGGGGGGGRFRAHGWDMLFIYVTGKGAPEYEHPVGSWAFIFAAFLAVGSSVPPRQRTAGGREW